MENEHFAVWMRTSASPNLKKLWGRVDETIQPGTYKMLVNDHTDTSEFDATKYVLLSTTTKFGGKNWVLGISLLAAGGISTLWLLIFIFYPMCYRRPTLEEVFK